MSTEMPGAQPGMSLPSYLPSYLPAYLRMIAERIEAAEEAGRPAEVLRLIEVMRDALGAQVAKRVAALPGSPG